MRNVEVIPFSKKWKTKFTIEKTILKNIFKDNIVNIYHIGSTSIPGLAAKPIIDILVVVKNLGKIDKKNNEMIKIGYKPLGEYGIKNRRFFQKDGSNRSHHVHVFQSADDNIVRHLAFRDYLIHNEKRFKEYELLKIKLAGQFPFDIDAYCKGKDSMIKEIENEALVWYKKHNE
jgi:GrpB-like predicted nucleotidyltransferase (UPF0157 family)